MTSNASQGWPEDTPAPAAPSLVKAVRRGKAQLKRLSIRQKIYLGYLLSLGIALAGTTAGVALGRQAYELAEERREDVIEEVSLISQAQLQLSHLRLHRQKLPATVLNPAELSDTTILLKEHLTQFADAWTAVKQSYIDSRVEESAQETAMLKTLVSTYDAIVTDYLNHLTWEAGTVRAALPIPVNPDELRAILDDPEDLRLDQTMEKLTDDLDRLQEVALQEQIAATVKLEQAQKTLILVMLGSIGLSVAIASLLARAISRAIAQPIDEVSAVAREVTEKGDFNLRAPVRSQDEIAVLATSLNHLIERVKQLLAEQEASTRQTLIQSEKMSSLGQMVAGVAHEINNPVNFLYGNLRHVEGYIADLLDLIHTFNTAQVDPAVEAKADDIDLPFLEEDLPKLLQSMRLGADRTRQILLSLKNFSRLDEGEAHLMDVHECIDSTLLILHSRIKKGVTVTLNYGDIPAIEGFAGSLYQVFMNLLVNALDALEEQTAPTPEITITTERMGRDRIQIRIADNGKGIAPSDLEHIFEAFFTTKPSGIGTGLGLAISRQIIEEKHGGHITCNSSSKDGTEFVLELPIARVQPPTANPELAAATTP